MGQRFEFDIHFDEQDLRSRLAANTRRIPYRRQAEVFTKVVLSVLILGYVAYPKPPYGWFLAGFISAYVAFLILAQIQRRAVKSDPNGLSLQPHRMQIDDLHIQTSSPVFQSTMKWSAILGLEIAVRHVFLRFDRFNSFTVPRRVFKDAEEENDFIEFVKSKVASNPNHTIEETVSDEEFSIVRNPRR